MQDKLYVTAQKEQVGFSATLVKWTSACPVFCFVDFVHSKKTALHTRSF